VARYVDLFEAVPVHDGIDDAEGARFQILQLGDCLLRLAQPLEDNTPLGAHVARWGNMIYSTTMQVRDVSAAEEWLTKKGVGAKRLTSELLAADPADTFGAPYFFSTATIPNDPFA